MAVRGVLTLHRSSTLGHSSFACEHQPAAEQRAVVTVGDDWLTSLGAKRVDVIVLHVEGWELHVLRGLEGVLARSRPLIAMVEVVNWALRAAGTSMEELLTFLRDRDFELRWATEYGPHFPCGVWGPSWTIPRPL